MGVQALPPGREVVRVPERRERHVVPGLAERRGHPPVVGQVLLNGAAHHPHPQPRHLPRVQGALQHIRDPVHDPPVPAEPGLLRVVRRSGRSCRTPASGRRTHRGASCVASIDSAPRLAPYPTTGPRTATDECSNGRTDEARVRPYAVDPQYQLSRSSGDSRATRYAGTEPARTVAEAYADQSGQGLDLPAVVDHEQRHRVLGPAAGRRAELDRHLRRPRPGAIRSRRSHSPVSAASHHGRTYSGSSSTDGSPNTPGARSGTAGPLMVLTAPSGACTSNR